MGNLIKTLIALYYWDRLDKASKIFNSPLGVYSRKKSNKSPGKKAYYINQLVKLKELDQKEAFEFRVGVARNMNKKWKDYWGQVSLEQKVWFKNVIIGILQLSFII